MKKIFFSLVAIAALAACSKSDVAFEAAPEIGFQPVAKNATKAAIEGTSFNTTQDIYVFANAGLDSDTPADGVQIDECTEAYLRNAKFVRSEATAPYKGETPYYWPNIKSLSFAGYVDAGDAKTKTQANDAMTELTITDYVQPDSGNNDLMYFFTSSSYDKNLTGDVPVTMLHACSWLVFNFYGDSVTGVNSSAAWTIHEVTVKGITKTGTATLTSAGAEWNEGNQTADFNVYLDNNTGTALSNGTVNATIANNKNVIVIPQQTASLYIKYSYQTQVGNRIYEETTVELGYDDSDTDEEWNPGMKYTYSVTIGTKEISIMPTANDWANYDNDDPENPNDIDPIVPTI